MKINRAALRERILKHQAGKKRQTDRLNAQRREQYELKLRQFEEKMRPIWVEVRNAIDRAFSEGRVPVREELPEAVLQNSWYWATPPSEPEIEDDGAAYFNAILSFLEAVEGDTVTETAMARAGFRDLGRFFLDPDPGDDKVQRGEPKNFRL